jgi:class 3 adenylate cyclase/tetratricopeptide (TPR) repeat protein
VPVDPARGSVSAFDAALRVSAHPQRQQSVDTARRHSLAETSPVKCPACGALNPEGKRFCADCGVPLPVQCPACGTANAARNRFCGDCGTALPATPMPGPTATAAPTPPKPPSELATGAVRAGTASDAERRQLTVMFCDLVDSTALANRLDPEDLQRVIRSYHAAVAAAVAPLEGHVAQLLGDGVLVYFGYPRAHEDDASRAVRAALAVLPAVAVLEAPGGVELQTRIGTATGLVVVGEVGSGTPAAEHSASGETPNLAARLQALAAPGEIVLAEATRRLLGATFELVSLGAVALKGFAAPVPAWRVQTERAAASRFEAQQGAALGTFIGRDSEIALLLDRWSLARDGEAQVVLLSGEAGIGKSRICQALRERLAADHDAEPQSLPQAVQHASVVLQCSPYFGASALYPVLQHLERAAGIAGSDSPVMRSGKLQRLASALPSASVGALLRMMSLPEVAEAPDAAETAEAANTPVTVNANDVVRTPQEEKTHALRALVGLLRDLAREQPVLLLVEDAHWIDPTTEELIALLIDQLRDSRLLTLITCRPQYSPALGNPAHLTKLNLIRLSQRQCAALIDAVALGRKLPDQVQAEIIRKTDGVPLFVEELTKTVLQSGLLEDAGSGYRLTQALPELAIPSTLQDSLMARLDRLPAAKEVAQAGAAIGREFSKGLLAAVLQGSAARLDAALAELVRAELLVPRGVAPELSYTFKHALVRDTAYASMLKSQRALRHRQIAAALEQVEPETVAAQPELLAYHHQEAGDLELAIGQWTKAGKQAVARGANREAAASLERALALLEAQSETLQTMSDALDIRIVLGPVLFGLHGVLPELDDFYLKTQALAENLDDSSRLFQALWGQNYINFIAGRYPKALDVARRLLRVAHDNGDSGHLVEAHHAMWNALVMTGRHLEALVHLDQGDALYDPRQHATLRYQYGGHDPGACCLNWRAVTSWLLGFPDRALQEVNATLARVDELQHPMTNILLVYAAWIRYRRGEAQAAASLGERLTQIAEQHGFLAWIGGAVVLTALAQGRQPSPQQLRLLHERLVTGKSSKSVKWLMGSVLLDLCAATGDAELTADVLTPMLADGDNMHRAELLRIEGTLIMHGTSPDPAAAERRFHEAIQVAQDQHAKSFELRAATSLAELWQAQGKHAQARQLLGDIYNWFTEGFDTADLKHAKALLDCWDAGSIPASNTGLNAPGP